MSDFKQSNDDYFKEYDNKDPFDEALRKSSKLQPIHSSSKKQKEKRKRDKTAPRPAWQILLILPAFFIAVPLVYALIVRLIKDDGLAGTIYFILMIAFAIFVGIKSKDKKGSVKWKK